MSEVITRLREHEPALQEAIAGLEEIDADFNDHCGFTVATVAEWEERLSIARRLAAERPDFEIKIDGRMEVFEAVEADDP